MALWLLVASLFPLCTAHPWTVVRGKEGETKKLEIPVEGWTTALWYHPPWKHWFTFLVNTPARTWGNVDIVSEGLIFNPLNKSMGLDGRWRLKLLGPGIKEQIWDYFVEVEGGAARVIAREGETICLPAPSYEGSITDVKWSRPDNHERLPDFYDSRPSRRNITEDAGCTSELVQSDEGTYTIVVTARKGPALKKNHTSYYLQIEPPKTSWLNKKQGDTVALHALCPLDMVSCNWTVIPTGKQDGERVGAGGPVRGLYESDSSFYRGRVSAGANDLIIKNAQPADSGTYFAKCYSNTTKEANETRVVLDVSPKPPIFHMVTEGKDVLLFSMFCLGKGNNSILWLKEQALVGMRGIDGKWTSGTWEYSNKASGAQDWVKLSAAELGMEGRYIGSCSVNNRRQEEHFDLIMLQAEIEGARLVVCLPGPDPVFVQWNRTVLAGGNGYAHAKVEEVGVWLFDQWVTRMQKSQGNGSCMSIADLQLSEQGTYEAYAVYNDTREKNFSLEVEVAPRLHPPLVLYNYSGEGEDCNVTLRCIGNSSWRSPRWAWGTGKEEEGRELKFEWPWPTNLSLVCYYQNNYPPQRAETPVAFLSKCWEQEKTQSPAMGALALLLLCPILALIVCYIRWRGKSPRFLTVSAFPWEDEDEGFGEGDRSVDSETGEEEEPYEVVYWAPAGRPVILPPPPPPPPPPPSVEEDEGFEEGEEEAEQEEEERMEN